MVFEVMVSLIFTKNFSKPNKCDVVLATYAPTKAGKSASYSKTPTVITSMAKNRAANGV